MKKYLLIGLVLFTGFASARDDEGIKEFSSGNYQKAMIEFIKLAEDGDIDSQNMVGLMFDNGLGVAQDHIEAANWYRKSAEQGSDLGQMSLADTYYYGQGNPQDFMEAAKWYRKAAEQGLNVTQDMLGSMYFKGEGVQQDFIKAHMWWNLAAIGGLKNAAINRDIVAEKMTPAQIAEAQKLAREWKPKK